MSTPIFDALSQLNQPIQFAPTPHGEDVENDGNSTPNGGR